MTKKTFLIISLIVGLLIFSLSIGVVANNGGATTGSSNVVWGEAGQQCNLQLKLNQHSDTVDLGTHWIPGDILSSTYTNGAQNEVRVITNCADGYTLTVEKQSVTTPAGFNSSVPEDFSVKVGDSTHSAGDGPSSTLTTWKSLTSVRDIADDENAGNTTFFMDYQYETDIQDIPGSYSITLLYTVTS